MDKNEGREVPEAFVDEINDKLEQGKKGDTKEVNRNNQLEEVPWYKCETRWFNCIALHDFAGKNIDWKSWFEFTLSIFTKHGMEPTRLGVSGKPYGHSVKSLTFKGGLRKLQKYNFENIEDIDFMVMPNKDDYTTNFIIFTALYPHWKNPRRSFLSLCIDSKLEPFDKHSIEALATSLQNFTKAKYGYYYYRNLKNEPSSYIRGGNIRFISEEDKRLCNIWEKGRINNEYLTGQLRDIYKLNFLSQEHLDWKVGSANLQNWINSDKSHGELTKLTNGFWSWYVPEENILHVREALIPSGIIFCV